MSLLINTAYLLAAVITSPIWLISMIRTGKIRTDWRGRFGHGETMPRTDRPRVMIHAVSVGEVNATQLLVKRLAEDHRQPEIVIATTTDTGFARARSLYEAEHHVIRYPFDTSGAVSRVLKRIQPDVVGLMELEVWPNFLSGCRKRSIPLVVLNGRLSERSHRRYRRFRALIGGLFARLDFVATQDQTYADRFADLGVPPACLEVTGNMKWDTARIADEVEGADQLAREMGIDRSRPLVVAGSTAPSEHALLHESVPPGTQLLCAPRKPEWFDRAADDLPGCTRRSRGESGGSHDRFLLDTIGELRAAYALADVVVIGRTFTDLGGSDMIEPVALGKATVIGPDCRNFLDAVNRLSRGPGLIQCSEAELPDALAELLNNPAERSKLAEQGREIIRSAQGATERNATIICEMLDRTHNTPRPDRSEHEPSVAMSHSSD